MIRTDRLSSFTHTHKTLHIPPSWAIVDQRFRQDTASFDLRSTQHDIAPPETPTGLSRALSIASIPPTYDQALHEGTLDITNGSPAPLTPPNENNPEGNDNVEPPPYSTKEEIEEQSPNVYETAEPSVQAAEPSVQAAEPSVQTIEPAGPSVQAAGPSVQAAGSSISLARDSEHLMPLPSSGDAVVTRAVQQLQFQPPPRKNEILPNTIQSSLRPPSVIRAKGRSQYTTGASSSCIPSAIEACLQILYLRPLSPDALELILKAGSRYRGTSHIEAGKVRSQVKRYREALETVNEFHYPLIELRQLVSDLMRLAREKGKPVAAIITKPPESIMVAVHNEAGKNIIMFDSHPRPELHPDSAAFLEFKDPNGLLAYLRDLMPTPRDLNLQDLDMYQAMILGSVSVLVFTASKNEFNTTLSQQDLFMLEIQYENFDLRQENMSLIERLENLTRNNQMEFASMNETIRLLNEELRNISLSRGRKDMSGTLYNNSQRSSTGKGSSLKDLIWRPAHKNGATQVGNERFYNEPAYKNGATQAGNERLYNELAYKNGDTLTGPSHLFNDPQDSMSTRTGRQLGEIADHSDFELARRLQEEEQIRDTFDDQDAAMARRLQEEFEKEESRLEADRSQAKLYNQRILECPICSDQYPLDDTFHLEDCSHDICRTCAAQYIQTAVRDRNFPCLCPCCTANNEQTSSEIPQHMALSVLGEEDQMTWLSLERERGITSVSGVKFIYCRNKKCEKPFEVGTLKEADRLARVTCPYCQHQWCEKCDIDTWHEGATCRQYQKWKEDNGKADELTDATVKKAGYKKCPGMYCTFFNRRVSSFELKTP